MLSERRLREMREQATKATKGRWGAFGMGLLSGESGMNADTAEHVADFFTADGHGRPRTFDLDHVVNMQPCNAVALIDEVLSLREAKRDLVEALRLTREYVEPSIRLPAIPGWTWYDAVAKHAPERLDDFVASAPIEERPAGTAPLMGLHDESPGREAQIQADRGGVAVSYLDAEGWQTVEPARPHWRLRLAARFREYGWHGLADAMEREHRR